MDKRRFHLRVVLAVSAAVSALLVGTGWLIWLLERDAPGSNIATYGDALWWAMETITTVGYGDHHPVTTAGRVVAGGLMVTGLAMVGMITATIVTWFFAELDVTREVREIEQEEALERATLEAVMERLDRIDRRLAELERRS